MADTPSFAAHAAAHMASADAAAFPAADVLTSSCYSRRWSLGCLAVAADPAAAHMASATKAAPPIAALLLAAASATIVPVAAVHAAAVPMAAALLTAALVAAAPVVAAPWLM